MKTNVFEHKNYKSFLEATLKSSPYGGRGLRKQWSEAMGCQMAFVSQVMNGEMHLNSEQAFHLAEHLKLDEHEKDFFLLLVSYARAGSFKLKKFYDKKIREKIESSMLLKNKVQISRSLSLENQVIYYSKWYFSATHIAVTIPGLTTAEKIAEAMDLPVPLVKKTLNFLEGCGLVELKGSEYSSAVTRLYLEKDSPMVSKLHTIWRLKAIEAQGAAEENSLHFSSTVSLSKEDAIKLRQMIAGYVEELMAIVKTSKEETLYSFSVDYFSLLPKLM
ncbi:MAG: TIGR02147 family protein [Pseudobdellovibrionaceae bacterium]